MAISPVAQQALDIAHNVLVDVPEKVVPFNLPNQWVDPNGRIINVPLGGVMSLPSLAPATTAIKLQYNFITAADEKFSEIYYTGKPATVPVQGGGLFQYVPSVADPILSARGAFLDDDITLQSITASDVLSGGRLEWPIRTKGTFVPPSPTNAGPAPAGVCAVYKCFGVAATTRKVWFRGWPYPMLESNDITGKGDITAGAHGLVSAFFGLAAAAGYGVLTRQKAKSPGSTSPKVFIETLAPVASGIGWTTVQTYSPHNLADGAQIIIGQVDKKKYPGLNAQWSISYVNATSFQIPYANLQAGTVGVGAGYMRKYIPLAVDVFQPGLCVLQYVGVRQTNSAYSRSRGAKKGNRGVRQAV